MRLLWKFAAGMLTWLTVCGPAIAESVHLSGIAHVALRVANLEISRAFYQKLGFEQAFEFSDGGKVTQSFIKIGDHQFIELYPRTRDDQSVGLMHVCYESTDIVVLRELLARRDADPTDVKKARAGNLLFVLHDPENELVEYTQYLPGSLHSDDQGKHLGPNRTSEHLKKVVIPVKNAATEQGFYTTRLGFMEVAGREHSLGIPDSRDLLELKATSENTTELQFTVTDLKKAERELQEAGLTPKRDGGILAVTDPDGNRILFEH